MIAADSPQIRAAYGLPVRLLVKAWPELKDLVIQAEPSCGSPRQDQGLPMYFPTASSVSPNVFSPGRKRIFLSYKRGVQPDEALALYVSEVLGKQHDVFIDQVMPVGTAWRERIQAELESCDFLIPLLSQHSAHSEMVEYEISAAHHLGRSRGGKPAILPVRLAYSEPFEYPLSAYLNHLNWALWQNEQGSQALANELLTAMAGGQLSLADVQSRQAASQPLIGTEMPHPTASANPARLERPDGTMDPESAFYIERPGDAVMQRELARGGATIVIKAPRQMGKSSLLVRAATRAAQLGRTVAFLDFQLLDEEVLGDPQRFFQGFCRWIADVLDLDDRVGEAWQGGLGHVQSCTKYLRRHVLKALSCPLVLAMDEVDRMLACPFRSDFFGMLRSWHNSRLAGSEWKNLDLLLVISTEPYLLIDDLKQSPFNVGEIIRLEDFSLAQTQDLNARHGSPFADAQVQRLHKLLGGHPYLTRQALYRVATGEISPADLFARAAGDDGPFGDHLRRHLARFSERPELERALLQVIRRQSCPDELLYNRLHGAGLAQRLGGQTLPRCELYAAYFKEHLEDA